MVNMGCGYAGLVVVRVPSSRSVASCLEVPKFPPRNSRLKEARSNEQNHKTGAEGLMSNLKNITHNDKPTLKERKGVGRAGGGLGLLKAKDASHPNGATPSNPVAVASSFKLPWPSVLWDK